MISSVEGASAAALLRAQVAAGRSFPYRLSRTAQVDLADAYVRQRVTHGRRLVPARRGPRCAGGVGGVRAGAASAYGGNRWPWLQQVNHDITAGRHDFGGAYREEPAGFVDADPGTGRDVQGAFTTALSAALAAEPGPAPAGQLSSLVTLARPKELEPLTF